MSSGLTIVNLNAGAPRRARPVCSPAWPAPRRWPAVHPSSRSSGVRSWAGLLLFLSYSLLSEWLGTARRRLSRAGLRLIVVIVAVTGFSGFLAAPAIGLLFSCVSFAIRYGRIPAVRHSLTGNQKAQPR